MTRLLNGQILFALGLAALNTVYATQLSEMGRPFSDGQPGPSFMPIILCGFMYVATLLIILGEFRGRPETPEETMSSDTIPRIGIVGPLIAIGLIAFFIVAFVYTGYVVAATIYTFLIALYFNYEKSGNFGKSALTAIAISAFVTLSGWLFFVKFFDLYLPVWEL